MLSAEFRGPGCETGCYLEGNELGFDFGSLISSATGALSSLLKPAATPTQQAQPPSSVCGIVNNPLASVIGGALSKLPGVGGIVGQASAAAQSMCRPPTYSPPPSYSPPARVPGVTVSKVYPAGTIYSQNPSTRMYHILTPGLSGYGFHGGLGATQVALSPPGAPAQMVPWTTFLIAEQGAGAGTQPPAETPWYKDWKILAPAGAVVLLGGFFLLKK